MSRPGAQRLRKRSRYPSAITSLSFQDQLSLSHNVQWINQTNFVQRLVDRMPLHIGRSLPLSQLRPEFVAHHVAGAAGGGKLLAEFVEWGPVIVYNGDDVALRVAHRWQLPKQEDRLTVADQ